MEVSYDEGIRKVDDYSLRANEVPCGSPNSLIFINKFNIDATLDYSSKKADILDIAR